MLDQNTLVVILIAFLSPVFAFLYYFIAKVAFNSAIEEQQGKKSLNRWFIVMIVLGFLATYAFIARPFSESVYATNPLPKESLYFVALALLYIGLEVPYQLTKMAAKDAAEELLSAGDDRRNMARLKSAQTLATIMGRKLKVSCELQAFTNNDEFIFLTYIIDNKPFATRLKLNQADKPENWKKLGEAIMQNHQKFPQQTSL